MKKFLLGVLKILIFFAIVAGVIIGLYYTLFKEYYNTSGGYMRSLADINDVYITETKADRLHSDILSLGFEQTATDRYERAYNARTCEVLVVDEDEYIYMVTDTCYSVMEQKIVADFDGNGKNLLYYRSSESDTAFYRESSTDSVGLIEYNFSTSQYSFTGKKLNQLTMEGYNRSYKILIDEFNAKVF